MEEEERISDQSLAGVTQHKCFTKPSLYCYVGEPLLGWDGKEDEPSKPKVKEEVISSAERERQQEYQLLSNALSKRNWMDDLLEILERRPRALGEPQGDSLQPVSFLLELGKLSKEFALIAKRVGQKIIEEINLPSKQRTIHPVVLGGTAGGIKFIYEGIFFKFALDEHNLYGGHEFAMKAAGHEIKNLNLYTSLLVQKKIPEGLHVPLMALIHYRGYCLIAASILPINGDTIVYGSSDGGRYVHASDPYANGMMEAAARELNIKPHHVRNVRICGCGDMECHKGEDGRYYLLDTHRIMPPAFPDSSLTGCYLYRLFRPEFVKTYKLPLCSDGFCGWGKPTNNVLEVENMKILLQHNEELAEATNYLLSVTIPNFAAVVNAHQYQSDFWRVSKGESHSMLRDLSKHESHTGLVWNADKFISILHQEGINVRYLLLVRQHVLDETFRGFILMEVVARVCKNIIRNKLRVLNSSEDSAYHKLVAQFYNLLFGNSEKSRYWWENVLRSEMLKRFGVHRKEGKEVEREIEGLKFEYYVRHIDAQWLCERLNFFAGVKWTKEARRHKLKLLFENFKAYREVTSAISSVRRNDERGEVDEGRVKDEGVGKRREEGLDVGSYVQAGSFEELLCTSQSNEPMGKGREAVEDDVGSYLDKTSFEELRNLQAGGRVAGGGEENLRDAESEFSQDNYVNPYASMDLQHLLAEAARGPHKRFSELKLSREEKNARADWKLKSRDIKKLRGRIKIMSYPSSTLGNPISPTFDSEILELLKQHRFQEAVSKFPSEADLLYNQGTLFYRQALYATSQEEKIIFLEKALERFTELLALHSNNAEDNTSSQYVDSKIATAAREWRDKVLQALQD